MSMSYFPELETITLWGKKGIKVADEFNVANQLIWDKKFILDFRGGPRIKIWKKEAKEWVSG